MRPLAPLALAVAAAGLLTTGALAQSAQKISIQVSGLGAKLSGDAFEGLGTGVGFEAQVRYNLSAFSIGGGFQLTKHTLTDDVGNKFPEKVSLGGVFVEPRYVIPISSNSVAPYISARLSYLKESVKFAVGTDEAKVSASGGTINGGGGVLVRLTSRLNLDAGVTVGWTKFGDGTAQVNGQSIAAFEAGSGSNVVFRVGLAIGIGN